MKPTVFTVEPEHLGSLEASEAVSFFAELLWAEARRIGVDVTKINISSRVNAPDGGVDASFDGPLPPNTVTFLQSGPSTYQIKAGATFKPAQESAIKEALLSGKDGGLAPMVKACLDAGGSYTLVCTGTDPTASEMDSAKQHMCTLLASKGYKDPKVFVWGQNNLIAHVGSFPSLALRLNGRA